MSQPEPPQDVHALRDRAEQAEGLRREGMTALTERLQAIRARCEQATPGPWRQVEHYRPETGDHGTSAAAPYIVDAHGRNVAAAMIGGFEDMAEVGANVGFIAHARADLPLLVQALTLATEALGDIADAEATSDAGKYSLRTLTALDALSQGEKPVGMMLNTPITAAERDRISKDGP